MEQKNLGYSLGNVPIASKASFMKKLLEKTESVIRRMRWKALFFEKPELKGPGIETYGFKSNKAPPQMEHLNAFENDVYDLVSNIEFNQRRNDFQKKLSKDVREINKSGNVLVAADKTTNLYSMTSEHYGKLVKENVTKAYKKARDSIKHDIDKEGSDITTGLQLADRMEVIAERAAFITLKDHKPDFANKPSCRLINPAKSEVGIISKSIIERVNNRVRGASGLQQWKNTQSVIDWFNSIPDRAKLKFIKFDIVEFYPSITEDLLAKSLEYAQTLTDISDSEKAIIWHSRKSLLFNNSSTWTKKQGGNFDVTMGSYDGAEVCELVGLYVLSVLCKRFCKDHLGLYRDDGLAALKLSGPQADKARKDLCEIFRACDLKVTVEILLDQTDFLDVTFDLPSGKYWAYRKPNDEPLYIHAKSSHPPNVIKNLPSMIGNRLNSISCDKEKFDHAKPAYEEALQKSGFNGTLQYSPPQRQNPQKKARKRKITWFNPPYDQGVSTNVARKFLCLVDKHFPKHHRYQKLFNRNTVKVSYSCMPNMASIISNHNTKVQTPDPEPCKRTCSCRRKEHCPLDGNCLAECIVYQATITTATKPARHYFGLTEGNFKTRYNAHMHSFRTEQGKKATELSKYVWDLKSEDLEYDIKWKMAQKAAPYRCGSRRCDICLSEKAVIATGDPLSMLNKRAEIVSTCRHRAKFRFTKLQTAPT